MFSWFNVGHNQVDIPLHQVGCVCVFLLHTYTYMYAHAPAFKHECPSFLPHSDAHACMSCRSSAAREALRDLQMDPHLSSQVSHESGLA